MPTLPRTRPPHGRAARMAAGAASLAAAFLLAGCGSATPDPPPAAPAAPSTPEAQLGRPDPGAPAEPAAPADSGESRTPDRNGATPTSSATPTALPSSPLPAREGVLRIGIPGDRPGLSQRDRGGAPSGVDADAARVVSAFLGFEMDQVEWVDLTSRTPEAELAAGRIDLALGGVGASGSDLRMAVAGPYAAMRLGLLVPEDSDVRAPADLAGRRVCAAEGSAAAAALGPLLPTGADVLPQGSVAECATALGSGRVDAVAGDEPVLAALARSGDAGTGARLTDAPYGTATYGVGLPAGSSLCPEVTAALLEWQRDGSAARAGQTLEARSGIATDAFLRALSTPDPRRCD